MIITTDSNGPVEAKIITLEIDGLQYVVTEDCGRLKLRSVQGAFYVTHNAEPNTYLFISDREE